MPQTFYDRPILNSPYESPGLHWELKSRRPTNNIKEGRRPCDLITPVPPAKKTLPKDGEKQMPMVLPGDRLSSKEQTYDAIKTINALREQVAKWREEPNPKKWHVTPTTERLLWHWRHHRFEQYRPFFCQIEAVETAIWLVEVAPKVPAWKKKFWDHIENGNAKANPELLRMALKLATGAGKTTVMAMLIAWQTLNAVRYPKDNRFSRGFLIVTPGITIKDRLRVLQPNDPENYYEHRDLVPPELRRDIESNANIVITNYHAFMLRERLAVSKGTRKALEGWRKQKLQTQETEGQMIQRVMPGLARLKNIVVLNDEAHHCYRQKAKGAEDNEESDIEREEKKEAEANNEAARVWISGLESVRRKLGISLVYDLSATPFFLRGSGYEEGTLFPWTVSDFSLMDAIESGIVKLPRVPVADNIPEAKVPMFRELWKHIRGKMPKKGRAASGQSLDPLELPAELRTALDALYGHYRKSFALWQEKKIGIPPVFIVVCNNTATSDLVYKYISGFEYVRDDGSSSLHRGHFELFRNYDESGKRLARPNTILIDSTQLESGDALSKDFRAVADAEIAQFRRERARRLGAGQDAGEIDDATLLREVTNTVGKEGRLGERIRCVVSVSMLTEGWDATNVTHILGVRAFGTQLLCEQVVGRALRRRSYDLNEHGLLGVEYADVLGVPFDFASKTTIVNGPPPESVTHVHAVSPERDHLAIEFPQVRGYRVELPQERLQANFGKDHILELTPELVGATQITNEGIIGEGVELTVEYLDHVRDATIIYHLAKYLLENKFRDPGEPPRLHLFGQWKRITRQWIESGCLQCSGNTSRAQLLYKVLADMAVERIKAAITETLSAERPVKTILDPYNPTGSTAYVNFKTAKEARPTDPRKCHINYVVYDSGWEAELCRVAERHPRVISYVKNQNLGFAVPYLLGGTPRRYFPDFIARVDIGGGEILNLVVEIKGQRKEDAKDKANTMRAYWVPGVNNLGRYGRWDFLELQDAFAIESEFGEFVKQITRKEAA